MTNTRKINDILKISTISLSIIIFLLTSCKEKTISQDDNQPNNDMTNNKTIIEYPYSIDELEIKSVFDYTGMNVDDNFTDGECIVSLEVVNKSSKILEQGKITITTSNNEKLEFVINYLLPSQSCYVFESNSLNSSAEHNDIKVESTFIDEFDYESSLKIKTTSDGEIVIKNKTGKTLNNILVQYKCSLDGVYFGGVSYPIEIESLEPNKTFTYTDQYCLMGDTKIVYVSLGN